MDIKFYGSIDFRTGIVVLGEFQWLVRSMVFSSFVTYGLVTWLRHAGKASIANYWWATVTFTACRLVCNMVGVRTHVRRARVKNLAEYRREKREAELRLRTCPPWFDKHQKKCRRAAHRYRARRAPRRKAL